MQTPQYNGQCQAAMAMVMTTAMLSCCTGSLLQINVNRIFCFAFVTAVSLLCRVSNVLAPARPFLGGDAPLPLLLNPVDCFLESFSFKSEFQIGPGLKLIP